MSATQPAGLTEPALEIKCLQADTAAWDTYVTRSPAATCYHLSAWRNILQDVFGYRCYYLYARAGESLVGILPLTHFKNLIAGNTLSSTPFLVYGGPVGDSPIVVEALLSEAKHLAERLNVDYLEIRSRSPLQGSWLNKDLYVYFRKELDPDLEANLLAIPRKQRAMVRKGIEGGLATEWTMDIERFYPIFVESYRNLGTPVFARKLFYSLAEEFGSDCWLTTILHGSRPVAGVMSFRFRDEILPYYGGGTSDARALHANDFMYWAVMKRAVEEGMRYFDYGRSKVDTGSYRFKKHWGFVPEPLCYQYHLVKASEIPDLSPSNPRFKLAIDLWKRIPISLAGLIGPPIARRVG